MVEVEEIGLNGRLAELVVVEGFSWRGGRRLGGGAFRVARAGGWNGCIGWVISRRRRVWPRLRSELTRKRARGRRRDLRSLC